MKFLIDNQLPPKLAQWITTQGYDVAHVQDIGLADAPDIEILEFAANNRYVLVSKDEDFLHLSLTRRGRPADCMGAVGKLQNYKPAFSIW